MHRLLIVDGHAYAYRGFYAIRGMRSAAGRGTGGIYGFVKMLGRLRAGLGASHVGVVWDGGLSAERLAVWPGYKAERPELPAELGEQMGGMVRYLGAAGLGSFCREGVEADDWIGCVARAAAGAGFEVVIASADKDFMQLVSLGSGGLGLGSGAKSESRDASSESRGWIGLVNPGDKGERVGRVWGVAEVRSKTGVEPSQVVDWLSLVGDAVDGIPGVPGVGAKRAAELLNEFGSVENLFGRLAEVKSVRVREALRGAAEVVRRNQGLVRLPDLPGCGFAPEEWRVRSEDRAALAGLFREWGFRGMLAELEGSRSEVGGPAGPEHGRRVSNPTVGQQELI